MYKRQELTALGVQIGLDDFGTGFSSLAYLKRFPINFLKIDRSFMSGLGTSDDDTAIVTGTIALAHSLDLEVVAEGVETETQLTQLSKLKCNQRNALESLVRLIAPFAPFMAEELWNLLGNKRSVVYADFPIFDENYLKEADFEYPISVNGKLRAKLRLPLDYSKEQVEHKVLELEVLQKWLGANPPKKVIVVPKRIVNIVV